MGKKIKRRKIMIDPVFQYRFVKRMTALALLVVTSSTAVILVGLSLIKRKVSQPDPFSDDVFESLASMPDVLWMFITLWPYFLLGLVLVAMVSVLFGFFESFRIAGPVYRMRRVLKAMERGDFSHKTIRLRKHDELESLYRAMNNTHAQWKSNVMEMQDICNMSIDSDEKMKKISEKVFSFKAGEFCVDDHA